jgi:imidazole glycerol-phosphate synthase subunit HisH
MIAIIDYNIGNIAAVANMLRRIGLPCRITADPKEVAAADHIILPGNGSFDACMRNLRASGMVPVLEDRVLRDGVPLLGICVGAQMLGSESEEGRERGLGWIDMRVRRLPELSGLKVPHMGWNQVTPTQLNNRLTQGMTRDARFYFVHSYFLEPANREDMFLEATYGIEFAAGVSRANIAGVQFHPEKSHRFGKQLLTAFGRGE